MSRCTVALLLAASLLASASGGAQGQPPAEKGSSADREREATALAFARAHHPELADLLERLKTSDRSAYEKAVRDVYQAGDRLGKLRESDPQRYELALQTWTIDSRIRLLAARSTMSDDPAIEEGLRELLRERQQVRLATLRFDRDRLQARLTRIEEQIASLERDPVKSVESDLARIKRDMKASANRERRAAGKPAPPKRDSDARPAARDKARKSDPGAKAGNESAGKRSASSGKD